MKQLLTEIIRKLINIDLKPLTVICDQNNISVINSLMNDTKEKYLRCGNISTYREGSFEIDEFKVYPILDPPHLLKGMKNNFIKKDSHYSKNNVRKTAKWERVRKLYENDNGPIDGLKVVPHITDEHIYENKIRKMKVKNAAHIFSQRFASTLQLANQINSANKIGTHVEHTSELLFFFDRLFDSLNGLKKKSREGKNITVWFK
nr:uncharacterized protein LOC111508042 [Leptinotarsa decemlineata]